MSEAVSRALSFFHRQAPLEALCLYRASLGLLCAVEAALWLPHTTELFSSDGFHLGPLAEWAPPPGGAFTICLLLVVASLCVAGGFFTRTSLGVTLVLWSYLYAIDNINEKASSTIAIVALAILLASRSAQLYSIDAWRARRKRLVPSKPALGCIFSQRLLELNFAQVYLFAGLMKLTNPDWRSGAVITRALGSRWGTELGVWISGWVPAWLAGAAAAATIAYEVAAGILLFIPLARTWMICCGVLFHLAIQATLQVGSLGPHFLLALLLLYPSPEAVARVWNRSAVSWLR